MITGSCRAHFAYSCFKLAGSLWIVQNVIGAVSGPEGRKAAYNVTVAGLVEDIDKRLTSGLTKVGIKAYANQDDAAAAWTPGGFAATKGDNLERAARIFGTKAFGDQNVRYLYVVGTTVEGHKSNEPGVSQETDPSGSTVTLNGRDIGTYQSTITVTTRHGNVIVNQNQITYQNWKVSAMIHTHNAGHDNYSISNGDLLTGQNHGGDYGIAVDGISVYLVPTTGYTPYQMFRLDLSPDDNNMYFKTTREGQDYMNQQKKTIYLHEGKVNLNP